MPTVDLSWLQPGVACITLRHPSRRNAMTRSMWQQLTELATGLRAREGLRVVVLRGADGHFCAGGDISEYPSFRFSPDSLRQFHEHEVWPALQALLDIPVPLVGQIEGACMGAGLEMACCCDVRWAADGARFGAPIARLGFPMAPRELDLVRREAGDATAREVLLAAAELPAVTLLQRGFLHAVVPVADLAGGVAGLAARVAELAPQATRVHKLALRSPVHPAGDPYAYAGSAEHREGVNAFVERRSPVFPDLS